MNEINSFTFYRDYFNLIDTLPTKDKKELLCAIVDYVFKDIEPELKGHNQAIFNTLHYQIDGSKNNSKRSKGHGAPVGNKNALKNKPKTNEKQTENKPTDKPKTNKTSVLSFKFYISNFKFINNNTKLINKLDNWFNYKLQRKDKYTEIGINTLLNKINKNVEIYGTDKIIELIDYSISNNYQGIIWDRLTPNKNFKNEERSNQSMSEQIDAAFNL